MEFDEFGEPTDTSAYIVETLLSVAASGIVITAIAVAPGLGLILKAAAPSLRFEPNLVGQALRRLTQRGLIAKEQQGDQIKLTLTPQGRQRLDQYVVRDLHLLPPPREWDQRWRIVIFDVPEERKHLRAIFRRKLKQLGFRYLQRSAWIYPYPCEAVLTALVDRLDIGEHVHIAVTSVLSSDQQFRTRFQLDGTIDLFRRPLLSESAITQAPALAAQPPVSASDQDLIPLTEL